MIPIYGKPAQSRGGHEKLKFRSLGSRVSG